MEKKQNNKKYIIDYILYFVFHLLLFIVFVCIVHSVFGEQIDQNGAVSTIYSSEVYTGHIPPDINKLIKINPVKQEIKVLIYGCDDKDLNFVSNNSGLVSIKQITLDKMQNITNCRDRQILFRLAHYESTQQDICNSLGYCGLWQLGFGALQDCENYGIRDEASCTITHFKINPFRFDAFTFNQNSFDF